MERLNLLKNGFTRREDLDFTDDGARFTAYEYNGLIVTKSTWQGEYFIDVRVDYLKGHNFIYEDYCNKDWYKLCDEFNGTYNVDVNKLKENIDIIRKGIDELEEEIKQDPVDNALIENALLDEEMKIQKFIDEHKVINIMKYSKERISQVKHYLDRLQELKNGITSKLADKIYTRYDYKKVQKNGYLIFNEKNCFYTNEVIDLLK